MDRRWNGRLHCFKTSAKGKTEATTQSSSVILILFVFFSRLEARLGSEVKKSYVFSKATFLGVVPD